MILRKAYLDKIIPLIDKNLIKVLTGVRRAGKTILLQQIQTYLRQNGRDDRQIVYINFESRSNAHLKDPDALYRHILDAAKASSSKVYIFLDEIQSVSSWEEVVSSLLVDIDCDIYITGSNSKLLSGEDLSLTEYSDTLIYRIVEQVTVLSKKQIRIRFIGGLEITQQIE